MSSGDAASLEVSSLAYTKMVLHAAKYPYATVLGLLVGSSSSSATDAMPLLHHWITLSPMAEAGLALAEMHCKARQPPLRLLGIYIVNAHLDDTEAGSVPSLLAKAIAARTESAPLVLVLDNKRLAAGKEAFAVTPGRTVTLADPSSPAKALQLIRSGRHRMMGDFDDHLEDISVRWLDDPLDDDPNA